MSVDELKDPELDEDDLGEAGIDDELDADDGEVEENPPLVLDVQIDSPSACERHMTVTISADDVRRYHDNAVSEMMPSAAVPGFRPGRAPRKLVEGRFRREVKEQIKGSLLMDSLSQISEEQELTAISEPELDLEAVEVPDEGPMTFEFDLEVRPEFDLPQWRGLTIDRPTREFTDDEITLRLEKILARYGQLTPFDGPAAAGDYLTVNITCRHNGKQVSKAREQVIRVRPVLSFHDGKLEGFDKLIIGAEAEEKRTGQMALTDGAPNEELRGKTVDVEIEVLDVKKLRLPELTPDFLDEMGGFESEADVRDAIRDDLTRQMDYKQQQESRQQITSALVESANWELPPGLLRRQSEREFERTILELRRSGFSDDEIRSHLNQLRQNSAASTAKSLKEHFILERIAEEEEIEAVDADYDDEMQRIAAQSGESLRRVRAQIEKGGLMDSLRNLIIERKVLERVQENARFKDVPYKTDADEANIEAIDLAAGGRGQEEPPSAAHEEEAS